MKTVGIIGIIGLILLGVLLAAAPTIMEFIAFRKFPPAERAAMKAKYKAWKTKKITLPDAALEAKPYSPDIQNAAKAFGEAWAKYHKQAVDLVNREKKQGDTVSLATVGPELIKLTPLMDAYSVLVRHPDYAMEVFPNNAEVALSVPVPDYMAIQTCAKLLRIRALADAKEGRLEEASRDAATIVMVCRSDGFDRLIDQLVGIAICTIGTTAWDDVLRQCNDPSLLRKALDAQNTLAGQIKFFADRAVPIEYMDYLGLVREVKRRGIAMDYQNLTGKEFFAKSLTAQAEYFKAKVMPLAENDAEAARKIQQSIDYYQKTSAVCGGPAHNIAGSFIRLGGGLVAPMLYAVAVPNFLEAATRADVALSKFDMLRITTARKLYALEKGKAPATDAELVPAYLPALPTDRFEKGKVDFKETGGTIYSIGPDRKDNGYAITYDPSNGTVSVGDIALRAR